MPKIPGVTDEELANLSDAEREALEEGEQQEEGEKKDLKTIAEGKDTDKNGPDPDDEDEDDEDETAEEKAAREKAEATAAAEAEAKAKREQELKAMSAEDRAAAEAADKAVAEATAKAAAEAEAKAKAEAEANGKEGEKGEDAGAEEEEILRPRLPRYEVKPVEKYEEQIKALDTAYDAAVAKFTAGDLELPGLLAEQRKLDAQRVELREAHLRAEMATEFNEKAGQTEWMGDVQDFFVSVKEKDGIDYNRPLLNTAFDTAIKALAADEKNAKRSSQWFLREADKAVKAEIGFVVKPEDKGADKGGDKGADKGGEKAKPAGRKPALAVVKDVGGLPSAGDDDASGGNPEFAALDKLEGIDYEDALARMPQAKQDQYLRQRA